MDPLEQRIQQFKNMAEADPENELGHFSLGKAYLDSSRHTEAVKPLQRALELNPTMSRAYQLLGEALTKSNQRDEAIRVMTRGVSTADELGDRMPRDAMAEMLRKLSAPVPAFQAKERQPAAGGVSEDVSGFRCSKCGNPGGKLAKPPFRGPLGERVHENVCTSCWREWIGMGTKVINELKLVLANPESQDTYDQYMIEFLQL